MTKINKRAKDVRTVQCLIADDLPLSEAELSFVEAHMSDIVAEILRIVDIFRCKVVDVGFEHYTVEVTGDEGKLGADEKADSRQYAGLVVDRTECFGKVF